MTAAARIHRTTLGDVELEWDEHGAGGPTLALVHGYTGTRRDFEAHAPALAVGRRVAALDHRGLGGSTNPGDGATYTLERLADDLAAWLAVAGGGEPLDLLGHSMGGMLALRVVLARPELVRSLILMDTAAESPGAFTLPPEVGPLIRAHGLERMAALTPPRAEEKLLQALKGEDWLRENRRQRLSVMDPEAFLALFPLVFAGPALLERLGAIAVPTTIIVGERDEPFRGPSERLAAGIPGARLVVVEGAYHSPQHTHPEVWRAAVLEHLARVSSAGRA
jgi:pimeloyl-ACP methyl ester carboxylesterase